MKNRICFVIAYFGQLPYYFDLWLKSCEKNSDVDFIVFTDAKYKISDRFKNVRIIDFSLEKFNELATKKLNLNINVLSPYKLCDFKPAYGLVFEDYLKSYDFWGHCDIDLIFGKINDFVTTEMLENNDVIGQLGHFTLYRNNNDINRIHQKSGSIYNYKKVFTMNEHCAFDEFTGMSKIFKKHKVRLIKYIPIIDVNLRYERMQLLKHENYNNQVAFWEEGKIYRAYIENDTIKTDEFCYLHFQKRKPTMDDDFDARCESFYITNKRFIVKKCGVPTKEEIIRLADYKGVKFEKMESKKYRDNKIKDFLNSNFKKKCVWIKQKTLGKI